MTTALSSTRLQDRPFCVAQPQFHCSTLLLLSADTPREVYVCMYIYICIVCMWMDVCHVYDYVCMYVNLYVWMHICEAPLPETYQPIDSNTIQKIVLSNLFNVFALFLGGMHIPNESPFQVEGPTMENVWRCLVEVVARGNRSWMVAEELCIAAYCAMWLHFFKLWSFENLLGLHDELQSKNSLVI